MIHLGSFVDALVGSLIGMGIPPIQVTETYFIENTLGPSRYPMAKTDASAKGSGS